MITDEEVESGLDEAMRKFRLYAAGVRGQTITLKDSSDYWAFIVGYQLGRQHQRESDAALCQSIEQSYSNDLNVASAWQAAEAIINNTGGLK